MIPIAVLTGLLVFILASGVKMSAGSPAGGRGSPSTDRQPVGPSPTVPLLPPKPTPTIPAPPKPIDTRTPIQRKADAGRKKLVELLKAPDKPGTDIPIIDGKPAWYITTLAGNVMAIPNFTVILVVFQTLQREINRKLTGKKKIRVDGRLGTKMTLRAFKTIIKAEDFIKYPRTAAQLAANAVKWTEVIKRELHQSNVGNEYIGREAKEHSEAPDKWSVFAAAMKILGRDEVGHGGRLGYFAAAPKRLEQLGLMSDVSAANVEASGERLWVGKFVEPLTVDDFLDSPELQLRIFHQNMRGYVDEIRNTSALARLIGCKTPWGPVTMSGLLGLANQAGLKGAVQWVRKPRDRDRFPATTEAFKRVNGIF